jgi:hypothetical protein
MNHEGIGSLLVSSTLTMRLLSSLALLPSATAAVIPRGSPTCPQNSTIAVNEGYVFAYFRDNSLEGEKIFLAASKGNNALEWEELNGGEPVLTSTEVTKGLRDPFLIRVGSDRPTRVVQY